MNKTIIATVLLLVGLATGMAAPAFGQVAQLPNTTISTQCIDLNQDRICEAVVLANGTLINFTKPTPIKTPETQSQSMGKCQGFKDLPTFCKNLLMPNGEIVQNKTWTYGCLSGWYLSDNMCIGGIDYDSQKQSQQPQAQKVETEETTIWTDPDTGLVYDIPTQGDYCLDFNEDGLCDVDFTDGKMVVYNETEGEETQIEDAVGERPSEDKDSDNGDDRPNPYCDKLGIDERTNCWDRFDYYQGGPHNGLYPCNDGTNKKDPHDCKDASGYDYDNGNDNSNDEEDTGGSNPEGEEEDQNCGGESCTDDEKEDSWTDEDEGVPLG